MRLLLQLFYKILGLRCGFAFQVVQVLFICPPRDLSFSPWVEISRCSFLQDVVRIARIGFEDDLLGALRAADIESVDEKEVPRIEV